MDQAEFWRRCEQDFLRYCNEENEKLVVRWEASYDDVWTFEGPLYCARAFKALAKQGGYGLAKKRSLDAWKDWLDALRRNGYDSRFPLTQEARVSEQERQNRGLLAAVGRRKPGSLAAAFMKRQAAAAENALLSFKASAGVINTPFKNSALFCLELATEASNELDKPDEAVASQGFDWATFILDPLIEPRKPESDSVDVLDEANADETPPKLPRGPARDYETASQVAEIVARVAPDGDWRSRLEDICDELDERRVRCPKTWKKRGHGDWFDCLSTERELVVKAIEHHLKRARENPETFS